jgi:hypothetical protein
MHYHVRPPAEQHTTANFTAINRTHIRLHHNRLLALLVRFWRLAPFRPLVMREQYTAPLA